MSDKIRRKAPYAAITLKTLLPYGVSPFAEVRFSFIPDITKKARHIPDFSDGLKGC